MVVPKAAIAKAAEAEETKRARRRDVMNFMVTGQTVTGTPQIRRNAYSQKGAMCLTKLARGIAFPWRLEVASNFSIG